MPGGMVIGVAIVDFGSQFTQLIRRRLMGIGVRAAVFSASDDPGYVASLGPSALILSGGPFSVNGGEFDSKVIAQYLAMNVPILAICYGMQAICQVLGGGVSSGVQREFGETDIQIVDDSDIFCDIPSRVSVWMSHCDTVDALPAGFRVLARSENGYIVAASNSERHIYCVQFHPEVTHTQFGLEVLRNFAVNIASCKSDWYAGDVAGTLIEQIKANVLQGRAVAGVSGGVDSSVAAYLVHRAIGDRLTCVFIDNGLMREGEADQVEMIFAQLGIPIVRRDAGDLFLSRLAGVVDPERKRKIIGRTFIEVFEDAVDDSVEYLVQGTLHPDVVESLSGTGHTIKSHHNVGGLPDVMRLKLIEPLRSLFKDEAREIGRLLHIPSEILDRHPFPGPGLAVRILGEVTKDRLAILRKADAIFIEEIIKAGFYNKIWQAFAVLITANTVGVVGDSRSYDNVCALRAVDSVDGMTARASVLDCEFLQRVANKIINNMPGISRVVYDITSKPPASIEWE